MIGRVGFSYLAPAGAVNFYLPPSQPSFLLHPVPRHPCKNKTYFRFIISSKVKIIMKREKRRFSFFPDLNAMLMKFGAAKIWRSKPGPNGEIEPDDWIYK